MAARCLQRVALTWRRSVGCCSGCRNPGLVSGTIPRTAGLTWRVTGGTESILQRCLQKLSSWQCFWPTLLCLFVFLHTYCHDTYSRTYHLCIGVHPVLWAICWICVPFVDQSDENDWRVSDCWLQWTSDTKCKICPGIFKVVCRRPVQKSKFENFCPGNFTGKFYRHMVPVIWHMLRLSLWFPAHEVTCFTVPG